MVAHPEGWHEVNCGSAASDARTVSVSEVPLPKVLTVSGSQIEAHSVAGWTNGVVKARKEAIVGDTTDVASPLDDVGRFSAIELECVVDERDVANPDRERRTGERLFPLSTCTIPCGEASGRNRSGKPT